MSLLHVLMLPIFLISVTSPFTRLMHPYELASFQVSASKKALKNVWIRRPHTPLPLLSPIPPSLILRELHLLWKWCCMNPLELVWFYF